MKLKVSNQSRNSNSHSKESDDMDTSHDIELFKEWLATITPMQVIKFLFIFAVYYILAVLFMVV